MPRRTDNSFLYDELLRVATLTTLTAVSILAPGGLRLFNKRLQQHFEKMDNNKRERELKKAIQYLRDQKLITNNYKHGIVVTDKAKIRLRDSDFNSLELPTARHWDKKWRIVFFDIPETKKSQRDSFARKIRNLGFKALQRSVFIYPFECRREVEILVAHYRVGKYVSYIEATYIDNQKVLEKKFSL